MPRGGAAQRAEHSAAVQSARHEREIDPRVPEWLAKIDETALDQTARRNVELIRKAHARATRVPAALSADLARITSSAQGIWADARAANNFADFAPVLAEVIRLRREEAACLAGGKDNLYDALLDDYEPGMTTAVLTPILDRLRVPLSELRAEIADSGRKTPPITGNFPEKAQMALTQKLAQVFCYDLETGRIDKSVHPFSSGSGGDVRITTRVDEADPLNCLYSSIHEIGHAVYEQNIASSSQFTPVGAYASMGVHESQSRMFENQIGRSRAFAEWLYPAFTEAFGECGIASPNAFFAAVNRVETGLIRTEADEVHYNLHVILRYNLERDLIDGSLEVADLEAEWNRRFEADFGLKVPDAARGVLQDVHWSVGLFGYFPTYSLGNIYAATLFETMREQIPAMDDMIAKGDISTLKTWLTENVHRHGNTFSPVELISNAAGKTPTEQPLISYLRRKFGGLYDL